MSPSPPANSEESAVLDPPRIVDPDADRAFARCLRERGWDPTARFSGGYVEWEWNHIRHFFEAAGAPLATQHALEFGCNLGATAIVLAHLGAHVTALDVDPWVVQAASLNAARYGLGEKIDFVHVGDSRRLPFASDRFDWVVCNSVLEYVVSDHIRAVVGELVRVLRPGGLVLIHGTSNRLWPREVHSRRWFTNYIPRWFDGWTKDGARRVRGVGPCTVRAAFRGFKDVTAREGGRIYVEAKRRAGTPPLTLVGIELMGRILSPVGLSPGLFAPSLAVLLARS